MQSKALEQLTEADLPTLWRQRAELLRDNGAGGHAKAVERCAEELETRDATQAKEELTLGQAAKISGFSVDHLRRMVRDQEVENVSTNGTIKVRRGDLPMKARSRRQRSKVASSVLGYHAD